MQVGGPRDAVTKFTATVALTIDPRVQTSASVTESASIGVPESLTATCSGNCKLGALLDAVVSATKEIVGWQTGTETAGAWNDRLAFLLAGCPYEEEFGKKIQDSLAAGQTITLERKNMKKTKHLTVKGMELNGKIVTEISEWSYPTDPVVTIDRVESEAGQTLKNMKVEVEACGVGASFTVHGRITRPTRGVRIFMCVLL